MTEENYLRMEYTYALLKYVPTQLFHKDNYACTEIHVTLTVILGECHSLRREVAGSLHKSKERER